MRPPGNCAATLAPGASIQMPRPRCLPLLARRVTRPANIAGLTARQIDVPRLAVRGLPDKQTAASLVVAPKTAGNHIEHICTKIAAPNRAGAALSAMRNGLLPDTSPHTEVPTS